jgi:hypothetical protein
MMYRVKTRNTGQRAFVVVDMQDRELIIECSTTTQADWLKRNLMQTKSITIIHKGTQERCQDEENSPKSRLEDPL